jgi:hypothetical protein
MAAYPPPSAAYPPSSRGPSTRVELHLSCKGLKKADVLSKSDPLIAVYTPAAKGWTEVLKFEKLFRLLIRGINYL